MKTRLKILFVIFLATQISSPQKLLASDFFIISDSYKKQAEAQSKAADTGGWVLISNLYKSLTPNLFAVVRGPFHSKKEAETELANLKINQHFKKSYVKDAGEMSIDLAALKLELSPVALAALLGEVRVLVKNEPASESPCSPQEENKSFSLQYFTVDRNIDAKGNMSFVPKDVNLDIGSFAQINHSGEIQRMRLCAE